MNAEPPASKLNVCTGSSTGSLRVLILTSLYPPAFRGGGPIRTTEAIVESHGDRFCFHVITSDTDWGESVPLDVETGRWVTRNKARVFYTQAKSPVLLLTALWHGARLRPEFVYINSFLSPRFSILPVLLSRFGFFGRANVVLAPRGEFGTAALALKSRKKQVFLAAARFIKLHSRVIWHASSETEASEIRKHFPAAHIVVRINESNLPARALRRVGLGTDVVRLVFISRISEIKGVTLLLEALSGVPQNVSLDLYGTAQNSSYLEECRSIAARMPPNITVNFRGGIENAKVRDVFKLADAFFLPTEHENFGHAIAESLSAGCPTFIEDVTPWTKVINSGGGRIVGEHTVAAWATALREYCSTTPPARVAMKTHAADAYERWRQGHEGPSVFDLILGENGVPANRL